MYLLKLWLYLYLIIQISKSEDPEAATGSTETENSVNEAENVPTETDDVNDRPRLPRRGRGRLMRESKTTFIEKNCGKTFNLERKQKYKFTSPNFNKDNYYPGFYCSLAFLGTSKCTPQIECTDFDLRSDTYDKLVVMDGIGGGLILTGRDINLLSTPHRASGGGRDLFLRFVTDPDKYFRRLYKGVSCVVSCLPKYREIATTLPSGGLVKKEQYNCVCGIQTTGGRVVGGEDAMQNEFPWQVALVEPGTREAFCGGSIINNQYILTATHCFWFSKKKAHQLEVLIHSHVLDFTIVSENANISVPLGKPGSMQSPGYRLPERTDEDEKSQRYKVAKIFMHPLFTELYDYDVALLRLDRKINLVGENAPIPICLPDIRNIGTTFDNELAIVSGWGLAHETAGASTRLLQKLKVPIISYPKCNAAMPNQITERMVCAGYLAGVQDACTGDSGGPLSLRRGQKQMMQIGIVSWGEGCARRDRPGVYGRVTEFLQWIYHYANTRHVTWCRTSAMESRAIISKGKKIKSRKSK